MIRAPGVDTSVSVNGGLANFSDWDPVMFVSAVVRSQQLSERRDGGRSSSSSSFPSPNRAQTIVRGF